MWTLVPISAHLFAKFRAIQELSAAPCNSICIRYSNMIMMGTDGKIYRQNWNQVGGLPLTATHQKGEKKIAKEREKILLA